MIYSLDIETIPNQSIDPPEFNPDTVALGNLKDQAKIEAKIEKAKNQFENGLTKEMSVNSNLCQIISFGAAEWDGENIKKNVVCDPDEKKVLSELKKYFNAENFGTYIGWNIKEFDLQVIWKRGVITGDPIIHTEKYLTMTKKYSTQNVMDLMHIWNNFGYGKLSDACKTLNIPCKTGLDGSMIYDAFKENRLQEIADYNIEDCLACLDIYRKLNGV